MIIQRVLVTIAAPNFDRSLTFYRSLLGEPIQQIPNVYAEFQLPGLTLGLYKPKHSDTVGTCMSLCLHVENLESAIAHLTDLGYPPPQELLQPSHGRETYIYDPDGNRIILYQPHSK